MKSPGTFAWRTVDELQVGDERSFQHVALYASLKEVLRRSRYRFQLLPPTRRARADRALLLNLTFWAADAGGDLLVGPRIEADVVAHAAWHHLAARALEPSARGARRRPSAAAMFLGESIASAFDVYLVGRALGHAPRSTFLKTQVPAMADAAAAAGMSRAGFQRLLSGLAADPDGAFSGLRELLFDATCALYACSSMREGYRALAALEGHRFSALLPRYEVSNWVLYARAFASGQTSDARVRGIDRLLRNRRALDWLTEHWVAPALSAPAAAPAARTAAPGSRQQSPTSPPRSARR